MRLKPILKGALTFVPGIRRILPQTSAGNHRLAIHCYERWMKHLVLAFNNGMNQLPESLVEIGPGDSLGVGIAAMLSGVNSYSALDVVRYANREYDLMLFDDLVRLFRARAGLHSQGWPNYGSMLDDRSFPGRILTEDLLEAALQEDRVSKLREAVAGADNQNGSLKVKYIVPWDAKEAIDANSIDMIVSHAVLQHVVSLEDTYAAMACWLKPGGIMSHQIDFRSMGMAEKWNGHWACSELFWKIIAGRRTYIINRHPCSVHVDLIEKQDCEVACLLKNYRHDGISRSMLSPTWRNMSQDDMMCAEAFIQARRVG